jgi:anaerobic C4-dicarboxylate transporter
MQRFEFLLRATFMGARVGFIYGLIGGIGVLIIYGKSVNPYYAVFSVTISFTVCFGIMALQEALKR